MWEVSTLLVSPARPSRAHTARIAALLAQHGDARHQALVAAAQLIEAHLADLGRRGAAPLGPAHARRVHRAQQAWEDRLGDVRAALGRARHDRAQ